MNKSLRFVFLAALFLLLVPASSFSAGWMSAEVGQGRARELKVAPDGSLVSMVEREGSLLLTKESPTGRSQKIVKTPKYAFRAQFAVDASGSIFVVWINSHDEDLSSETLQGKIIKSDGTELGPFNVTKPADLATPISVLPDPKGGWFLTYTRSDKLFLVKSTTEGVLAAPERIDLGATDESDPPPAIDAAGNLYFAAIDVESGDLKVTTRFSDGRRINQTPVQGICIETCELGGTDIAVSGSGVRTIAWCQLKGEEATVQVAKSEAPDQGFSSPHKLGSTSSDACNVDLNVNIAGDAVIGWLNGDGYKVKSSTRTAVSGWSGPRTVGAATGWYMFGGIKTAIGSNGTTLVSWVTDRKLHPVQKLKIVLGSVNGSPNVPKVIDASPESSYDVAVNGAGSAYALYATHDSSKARLATYTP